MSYLRLLCPHLRPLNPPTAHHTGHLRLLLVSIPVHSCPPKPPTDLHGTSLDASRASARRHSAPSSRWASSRFPTRQFPPAAGHDRRHSARTPGRMIHRNARRTMSSMSRLAVAFPSSPRDGGWTMRRRLRRTCSFFLRREHLRLRQHNATKQRLPHKSLAQFVLSHPPPTAIIPPTLLAHSLDLLLSPACAHAACCSPGRRLSSASPSMAPVRTRRRICATGVVRGYP